MPHPYQARFLKTIEVECGLPEGYIVKYVLNESDITFMKAKFWQPGRMLVPELVKFIKDKVKSPDEVANTPINL